MSLTSDEKENIKTYFLIKEGLEITEVTEFYNRLLLKPYGVIPFYDKIYKNKKIEQELILNNSKIEDVSTFSNLSNLRRLDLDFNKISDISPLSNLTNLTHLYIGNNKITDISPLSNLTNLKELSISVNKITDISPLSNLTNLKILSISVNNITDISPLSNLSNLTHLYSYNSNFSEEQIKELKLKLPNCSIHT